MDMGPRTNLYNIGGDPLTHLHFLKYIFFFADRNADSDEITENILLVNKLLVYVRWVWGRGPIYTSAVLRLECSLDCISVSVGHQQNIFRSFSQSAFLLKLKKM